MSGPALDDVFLRQTGRSLRDDGAGKATTLRVLATLLPIGSGSAIVAGFDAARQPAQVRTTIGYVSQLGGADELATGRENLILQGPEEAERLTRADVYAGSTSRSPGARAAGAVPGRADYRACPDRRLGPDAAWPPGPALHRVNVRSYAPLMISASAGSASSPTTR